MIFFSFFVLSARKKSLASGKCLNESLRSYFNETYNFADYVAAPGVLLARELPRGGEIYRLLERFLMENVFHSQELPHKRIVRNVRKMLETKPSRLELENLLTSLPRGSRPKRNYDDDSDWGMIRYKFCTFASSNAANKVCPFNLCLTEDCKAFGSSKAQIPRLHS